MIEKPQQIADDLRAWFVRKYDARPSTSRPCLQKLLYPRHRCSSGECHSQARNPRRFAPMDHLEWFQTGDGRFLAVGQPYGLSGLAELEAWAEANGLTLHVNEDPGWHPVDAIDFVVIVGAEDRPVVKGGWR